MGVFDVVTETERDPYGPAQPAIDDIINRTVTAGQTPFTPFQAGGENLSTYLGGIGTNLTGAMASGEGLDFDLVNRVADNPYMTGMIDASLRDSTRQLTENTLPGIAAYSAGGGNLGSSRRGAAEAIATRGYEDRAADVGASMRGQAYSQGLGISERMGNVGLNTLTNAATIHRNEEQLPFLQAEQMKNIILPIADAFKTTTETKEGNLEGVLLDALLFGTGEGGGAVNKVLDVIGLGGDGTTDTTTTEEDRLDLGGETISSTAGLGDTGLIDASGTIADTTVDLIGNVSGGQTTTGQTVADVATGQPITGGTARPDADRGDVPAGIIDPILNPQAGQDTTQQTGTAETQGQGGLMEGKDYGELDYVVDNNSGNLIPQREVTPGLVDDYLKELGDANPHIGQTEEERRAGARGILENNGGVLPSDEYQDPSSEQEFKDLAAENGIELTSEQLAAARAANPEWAASGAVAADASSGGAEETSDLVSGGFAGGNIQDGQYFDPTFTDFKLPGGGNLGDLISMIPGVENIQDLIGQGTDLVQGGIDTVTDAAQGVIDPIKETISDLPGNITAGINLPQIIKDMTGGGPDYGPMGPLGGDFQQGDLVAPSGDLEQLPEPTINGVPISERPPAKDYEGNVVSDSPMSSDNLPDSITDNPDFDKEAYDEAMEAAGFNDMTPEQIGNYATNIMGLVLAASGNQFPSGDISNFLFGGGGGGRTGVVTVTEGGH